MSSYKHEQAARHAMLSALDPTKDREAQDRLIASIERASREQTQGYMVIAVCAAIAFVLVALGKLAGWLFGFDF